MSFPHDQLRNKVADLWRTTSQEITRRFGLTSLPVPAGIEIVRAKDSKAEFGGTMKSETLFLSELAVSGQVSLKGVIARACLISAFPESDICPESIDDVSTEFARQVIDDSERKAWSEMWAEHVPERKFSEGITHNPSRSFPALFEMIGEIGLDTIVRDLLSASKYEIDFTLEDYLRYFESRARRFSVSLTKTNLQIVNRLLNDPDTSFEAIAKKLRLTPEWISARIGELRNRNILHKFDIVRFSRIGIRLFHLLLKTDSEGDSPHRYLADCPFLYTTNNVLSGEWRILATLAVPDNIDNIRALHSFQQAVAKWNVQTHLAEVVSSGARYCLDYYTTHNSSWAIPWDLERVQLARIHAGGLAKIFPKIVEAKQEGRPRLDELDMQILNAFWNRLDSISAIRAKLRVGQQRVAERVKRLRKQGIISANWEIHNIGLTEFAFASTEDAEVGNAIEAWSLRLPRCIISFDLDRRMMLQCSLPPGGGYGFAWATDVLPKAVSIGLLSPSIYGGWSFPMELWNPTMNYWESPKEKIGEWLESIR